ncbi:MAG TPA: hypothetical protein VLG50_05885 [Candidatus Saccharimonadales bacterium]|nr:hypothetical protein [Candidatus Saccharimonadales bacterium]
MNNKEELVKFSKDFITGQLTQPITYLYGNGNNGKKTLINMLIELAKENNIKSVKTRGEDLMAVFDYAGYDVRYIIIDDPPVDYLIKNQAVLKQLTGKDTICRDISRYFIEEPHADDLINPQVLKKFTGDDTLFVPNINFIFISNDMFDYNKYDKAFLKRIKIITMDGYYTKNDFVQWLS